MEEIDHLLEDMSEEDAQGSPQYAALVTGGTILARGEIMTRGDRFVFQVKETPEEGDDPFAGKPLPDGFERGRVIIARASLPLGDIPQLEEGALVPMDTALGDPVLLRFHNGYSYRGDLLYDGEWRFRTLLTMEEISTMHMQDRMRAAALADEDAGGTGLPREALYTSDDMEFHLSNVQGKSDSLNPLTVPEDTLETEDTSMDERLERLEAAEAEIDRDGGNLPDEPDAAVNYEWISLIVEGPYRAFLDEVRQGLIPQGEAPPITKENLVALGHFVQSFCETAGTELSTDAELLGEREPDSISLSVGRMGLRRIGAIKDSLTEGTPLILMEPRPLKGYVLAAIPPSCLRALAEQITNEPSDLPEGGLDEIALMGAEDRFIMIPQFFNKAWSSRLPIEPRMALAFPADVLEEAAPGTLTAFIEIRADIGGKPGSLQVYVPLSLLAPLLPILNEDYLEGNRAMPGELRRLFDAETVPTGDPGSKILSTDQIDALLGSVSSEPYERADELFHEGMYEEALQAYADALDETGDHPVVYNNMGLAWMHLGEDEKALRFLKKALEVDPDYLPALSNQARVYKRLGDIDRAIDITEESLGREESGDGYYNLACYRALKGNPDGALDALRRAVEMEDRFREMAREDEDFLSLAGDPEFMELTQS